MSVNVAEGNTIIGTGTITLPYAPGSVVSSRRGRRAVTRLFFSRVYGLIAVVELA